MNRRPLSVGSSRVGGQNTGLGLIVPPELVDAIAERVVERLTAEQPARAVDPDGWIDVTAAAEYIGKREDRIYDLVAKGAIRHGRDGRSLLFRRRDLDAYLLGHETDGEA